MEKEKLIGTLSNMIDQGFRYLVSQGWRRYRDGIVPPEDSQGRWDADHIDEKFRKSIIALENLRSELSDPPMDIPF